MSLPINIHLINDYIEKDNKYWLSSICVSDYFPLVNVRHKHKCIARRRVIIQWRKLRKKGKLEYSVKKATEMNLK